MGTPIRTVMVALSFSSVARALQEVHMAVHVDAHGDTPGGLPEVIAAGPPSESESVAYYARIADSFRAFAEVSRQGVDERHHTEFDRLKAEINATQDPVVRTGLEESLTSSEMSLYEVDRVYDSMLQFTGTLRSIVDRVTTHGFSCEETTCGEHALCTDTEVGAECVCREGYVGTATTGCTPPPEFAPRRILFEGQASAQTTMAKDMHVCVYGDNNIAIVFRDETRGDIGRLVVGRVREAGMADLAPPEQINAEGTKAYHPVVAGSGDRRLVVAWRSLNRLGAGHIAGAALGVSGIRGADWDLMWGEPPGSLAHEWHETPTIGHEVSHKMTALSLTGNRFIVFLSCQPETDGSGEAAGYAKLISVGQQGRVTVDGTFRFSDAPVSRLDVALLSPSSFVLAARAQPVEDDLDPEVLMAQEATAIYGEIFDDNVAFSPSPVNLEPTQQRIWARGVSLIAPGTFAYSYQSGDDHRIKMAVVEVDPATGQMEVVDGPVILREGFSPHVSMLSVPYLPSEPHTMTLFQEGNRNAMSVCAWGQEDKRVHSCEEFTWLQQRVASVAGVHLGGGKSFIVFSEESGTPYYMVFGLSKK